MDNGNFKAEVLNQLAQGKDKAIPGRVLAHRLGLKDSRPARLAIIDLIEDGTPVIGDSKGYYIAETPDEIKEAMQTLKNYGISAIIHRRALKYCLKRMEIPLPVVDNGQGRLL